VKTLREVAQKRTVLFGAAVDSSDLKPGTKSVLIARQCAILVSENDMKWDTIHPSDDCYDFSAADALFAFAKSHRLKVRGHTLCWHNQNPAWLRKKLRTASPKEARKVLEEHIHTVVSRYAGRVHSWDVVNEAISTRSGRRDKLRDSPWLSAIGPKYLEIAFRAAAEADPKSLLTYNDYGLESSRTEGKRRALLQLSAEMRAKGIPLHAVGLQSHLSATSRADSAWKGLDQFLDDIEGLGLQVYITELDVNDRNLSRSVADRDRVVAGVYAGYLGHVLAHRAIKAVLTWRLCDCDSWLRARGAKRPLPFDSRSKPKVAFSAIWKAFADRRVAPQRGKSPL
jgi:endo-1,4-beta-xylanase